MFRIDPANPAPIYAQLERAVRTAVAAGWLEPGDQLPTVRQLAVMLKINANTVARAYASLEREGVVETQRGVGTFIRIRSAYSERESTNHLARELRERSSVFIAEMAELGFSAADVIDHLQHTYQREAASNG
ncbi:MAG: GntR family transcriptional regulator [Gemmatimonadota bacterium]|nr:GntR family transcriptional regulator [Gemmatimonadota bacterium]